MPIGENAPAGMAIQRGWPSNGGPGGLKAGKRVAGFAIPDRFLYEIGSAGSDRKAPGRRR